MKKVNVSRSKEANEVVPATQETTMTSEQAQHDEPSTGDEPDLQQLQNNVLPTYARKLSHQSALDILEALKSGIKGAALAKQYGVDSSTISDIKVGRLYKKALLEFNAKHAPVVEEPVVEEIK